MPLVGIKRQTGTCASGYTFYACNNAQVVWTGCCALEACTSGCPEDARPDDDDGDDDDDGETATTTTGLCMFPAELIPA